MTSGSGVSSGAVGIVHAVSAEIELGELAPIAVPLKDDHLAPVVPDGCGCHEIFVDVDVGVFVFVPSADDGKPVPARGAIDAAVTGGELQVAEVVERLVDDEPTWIGMVPAVDAPWGGEERLRKAGTSGAFVKNGGEDACFGTAGESIRVGGQEEPVPTKLFDDCLLVAFGHVRSMPYTGLSAEGILGCAA